MDAFEKLLAMTIPEPQTKTVRLARLGLDITLREMSYNEVVKTSNEKEDSDFHYILAGTVSPDFRDPRFYEEKMGCATPVEALKKLLLHGEVKKVARVLDKLNGWGALSVADAPEKDAAAVAAGAEALEKN